MSQFPADPIASGADLMAFDLPGEINPFEAPRAGIGEEVLYQDLATNDDELIRTEHIGREANIKSLGHLYYIGGALAGLFAVLMGVMAAGGIPMPPNQGAPMDPTMRMVVFGFCAAFYLVLSILGVALGYGLTHLQVWARWTAIGVLSLGLPFVALYTMFVAALFSPTAGISILVIFGGFSGWFLYLLASGKAGVVFSSEYREIIRKTPHVRALTSLIAKIALVAILAIFLLIVVAVLARAGGG